MPIFGRLLPSRDLLALPTIRWLVISRFCTSTYFYSTTIVLFQEQRGLNLTAMFLMESMLSGAIWIADVPTSIWADRFGYRQMVILGCVLNLAGILCFVLSHNFWLFALANVLSGFAIACTSGSESALLYSSLSTELREKRGNAAFGLLSIASSSGLFLGLTTGSFLGAYSPTLAVEMSIAPLCCSLLAACCIPTRQAYQTVTPKLTQTSIKEIIKVALQSMRHQPGLIGLAIFNSSAFALINAIFWFNQLYFTRAGIPIFLFGPIMASAVGLQFIMVSNMDQFRQRLGTPIMLIISSLFPGIAYLLLTATEQPFLTGTLIACVLVFSAWRDPLIRNQLNKHIPDESRATTLSALSFIGSCTGIILNPLLGKLGDKGLTLTSLGIGTCLLLLCIFIPFVTKEPVQK